MDGRSFKVVFESADLCRGQRYHFGDHFCRYRTDISEPDGLPCESKVDESMGEAAEFLSDEDEEQGGTQVKVDINARIWTLREGTFEGADVKYASEGGERYNERDRNRDAVRDSDRKRSRDRDREYTQTRQPGKQFNHATEDMDRDRDPSSKERRKKWWREYNERDAILQVECALPPPALPATTPAAAAKKGAGKEAAKVELAFSGGKWHDDVKVLLGQLEKAGKLKEATLDEGDSCFESMCLFVLE